MRRITAVLAALVLTATAGCSPSRAADRTHTTSPSAHPATPSTAITSPAAPSTAVTSPAAPSAAVTSPAVPSTAAQAASVRPFAHVVVVVEENHGFDQIFGSPDAPYLNRLAHGGLLFTHSYAVTHPSQPNYVALFSGGTHGITDDSCPQRIRHNNLAAQLRASGRSFVGYSEDLPSVGFTGCTAGAYARKHAPWTDFPDLPGSVNRPFTRFPSAFANLPTVSFVIPNLDHDMHDGTIAQADTWLHNHLSRYARWARTHHSLLLVTWDEDDGSTADHILTLAWGAGVAARQYSGRIDHYRVLRTLEAMYHLRALGAAANRKPIGALVGR